ncbi:thyrotropin-releasing hormone receptor-like [Amphiura filiformis]|uniref:thyrotropin-releasing hormone receptor-like n=1 Tax=Amphiura filiformis TaxID=82378 RepID=UPI003B2241F0
MDRPSGNATICSEENTFNLSVISTAVKWLWSDTDTFIISSILFISTIGIVGNAVFLFTILRLRHMKNSLSFYIFNWCLCDILFLVIVNYWYISNCSHSPISYRTFAVRSAWGCAGWVISTHVWYFAGIEMNTLITVERYFAVCVPLRYRVMVGKRRTVRQLTLAWIVAICIAVTIIPQYGAYTSYCLIWPNQTEFQNLPKIHTFCEAVSENFMNFGEIIHLIVYLIALVCNTVLYIKIIKTLSNRDIGYVRGRRSEDVNMDQIDVRHHGDTRGHGTSRGRRLASVELDENITVRNQVARTFVINGVLFFLCQTPYRILTLEFLLDQYSDYGFLDVQQYNVLKNIAYGCYVLNSVINPYLYIGSCEYYRNAVRRAFRVRKT